MIAGTRRRLESQPRQFLRYDTAVSDRRGLPMPFIVLQLDLAVRVHSDAPESLMRRRYNPQFRTHCNHPDAGSGSAKPAVDWQTAAIGNGCVVMRKLAWLRLKPATGARYHELLRRNSLESEQWRRLQVIWRHLGAAS